MSYSKKEQKTFNFAFDDLIRNSGLDVVYTFTGIKQVKQQGKVLFIPRLESEAKPRIESSLNVLQTKEEEE